MACTDRKFLLATDLDDTKFACDNGKVTLQKNPLPTASVFVAPGQTCGSTTISLGYSKSPDCAAPGGQTAGTWEVRDSLGAVVQSGTDLAGNVVLASLCAESGPFTLYATVTDDCGTSEEVSAPFEVLPALPTATVNVADGQWCGAVDVTLGYTPNPACPGPLNIQTAGAWTLKDGNGAVLQTGTDLAGTITLASACGEVEPLSIEYFVTDGCGTGGASGSPTNPATDPFTTVEALPTAGIAPITPGQECDTTEITLTHTPDPACPNGTQLTGLWEIKTSPGGVLVASGTDLAGTIIVDLCTNPDEDLVVEYTTSDGCGTSPVATSPTFQVVPVPTGLRVPVLDSETSQQLDCPTSPITQVVDDGDAAFAQIGTWTSFNADPQNYQSDARYATSGTGANKATWTFTGLAPGYYEISTNWYAFGNRPDAAPYNIYDNTNLIGTILVDQRVTPAADVVVPDSDTSGTQNFEIIYHAEVLSGTLVVELTDADAGVTIADAVRIESKSDLVAYSYNGVNYFDNFAAFEAAIIANEPTTTATVVCDAGKLYVDVDAAAPMTEVFVDSQGPNAGVVIAPNQAFDNVSVDLQYYPNPNCDYAGQTSGYWELQFNGSPTGLNGTDLAGAIVIDVSPYVNGGDTRGASWPADFDKFSIEYTVTDLCGSDTTSTNFIPEPYIIDVFTYTGSTQSITPFVPTGWAGVVSGEGAFVQSWGAGGGGTNWGSNTGYPGTPPVPSGGGGYAEADFNATLLGDEVIVVGEGGKVAGVTVGTFGGGGLGGDAVPLASDFRGGSGGGLSGLFDNNSFTHANAMLIAGGGGGIGGSSASFGGVGGGLVGGNSGPNGNATSTGSTGGSQVAGGLGDPNFNPGTNGSALLGGNGGVDTANATGGSGGGGGGGYYGGGGGCGHIVITGGDVDTAGAGGSSYGHPSLALNFSTLSGSNHVSGGSTQPNYDPGTPPPGTAPTGNGEPTSVKSINGGDGRVVITWTI